MLTFDMWKQLFHFNWSIFQSYVWLQWVLSYLLKNKSRNVYFVIAYVFVRSVLLQEGFLWKIWWAVTFFHCYLLWLLNLSQTKVISNSLHQFAFEQDYAKWYQQSFKRLGLRTRNIWLHVGVIQFRDFVSILSVWRRTNYELESDRVGNPVVLSFEFESHIAVSNFPCLLGITADDNSIQMSIGGSSNLVS